MFLSGDLGSLWTTKNALAALGGGLGLPLFTGGRRIANLKMKKVEYERVLNNYYQTNLTAIQEINDAMVSIKLDEEKYQDTKNKRNWKEKTLAIVRTNSIKVQFQNLI